MEVSRKLQVKYGLTSEPTTTQVTAWVALTRANMSDGTESELAGEIAARYLFADYRSRVFATEADTLEMLLNEAEKKHGNK